MWRRRRSFRRGASFFPHRFSRGDVLEKPSMSDKASSTGKGSSGSKRTDKKSDDYLANIQDDDYDEEVEINSSAAVGQQDVVHDEFLLKSFWCCFQVLPARLLLQSGPV